jgi:hypothetical protein
MLLRRRGGPAGAGVDRFGKTGKASRRARGPRSIMAGMRVHRLFRLIVVPVTDCVYSANRFAEYHNLTVPFLP